MSHVVKKWAFGQMQAVKLQASLRLHLARLRGCAGSPEILLLKMSEGPFSCDTALIIMPS